MPKLRRLAGRDVLSILHGFGFQERAPSEAAMSNWFVKSKEHAKS